MFTAQGLHAIKVGVVHFAQVHLVVANIHNVQAFHESLHFHRPYKFRYFVPCLIGVSPYTVHMPSEFLYP